MAAGRNVDSKDCDLQKRGFTLVELIVIIFIISLLSVLVFPSFYGLGEKELDSEARRVASLLRYLNENAISTKKTCSLNFNLQEKTLSWKGSGEEKKENFKSLASLHLQSKGEVKEGQVIVFFGPLGIQESIAVHLKGEGRGMTVELNQLSGRTKVIQDEKEK